MQPRPLFGEAACPCTRERRGKGRRNPVHVARDCTANGCDADSIFGDDSNIITCYRLHEFQQLSLKLIAQGLLHATPLYNDTLPPSLCFHGEHSMASLTLEMRASLYISRYNHGAEDVATDLKKSLNSSNLKLVRQPPASIRQKRPAGSIRKVVAGRRSTFMTALSVEVAAGSFSAFVKQFSNKDVTHSERHVSCLLLVPRPPAFAISA